MFQGLFEQEKKTLGEVCQAVCGMQRDNGAKNLAQKEGLAIQSICWEDNARNKGSVWGPCISDMTLRVDDYVMPIIRQPNFTDLTWDVQIEKIPIVVGNELPNPNAPLKTVSLKDYLENMHLYVSKPLKQQFGYKPCNINLLSKDLKTQSDSHVIMSSQACFLPIESGKQSKFNVEIYNYQSKKQDPAVLAIVSTSKGTSAQVIEGQQQKLLFNNHGKKADFMGQRLTDNRIERGVSIEGEMTVQEKQSNVIVIIQVPLKQKPKPKPMYHHYNSNSKNNDKFMFGGSNCRGGYGGGGYGGFELSKPKMAMNVNECARHSLSRNSLRSKKKSHSNAQSNVEAAIVKVSERTVPTCICDTALGYVCSNNAYGHSTGVSCDVCGKEAGPGEMIYHCPKGKSHWKHKNGYDLCKVCGEKQLQFDEFNGIDKIERDSRFPIRVTLQYYKSTDNGIINESIIKDIAYQLQASKKQADFVGSLVIEAKGDRPTEHNMCNFNNVKFPMLDNANKDKYTVVKQALNQLQMNDYLPIFIDNEVTDDTLNSLSNEMVAELITKIGPRAKFIKWLDNFKQIVKPQDTDFLKGFF